MKRTVRLRWPVAAGIALFCIVLVALWQWQTLARFAIVAGVQAFAHVQLGFADAQLRASGARFTGITIKSDRGEPIATIARVELAYDLRDLWPGGRRLYGLRSVEVDAPDITLMRRADGTFNIPTSHLRPSPGAATPLVVRARIRDGSIRIIDQSGYAVPGRTEQYARSVQADAEISTASLSTYRVSLRYGERADRLYPVFGRGTIDYTHAYINQRWTAARLPVASAINFALNSPSLRVWSGELSNVDAHYFGLRDEDSRLRTHLAVGASFRDGDISVAGITAHVAQIAGPVDVYDNGLLTPQMVASVAGIPAQITGGLYDLRDPRLRVAVRGRGELERLRNAFAQGRRLPVRGPIDFGLLIEGSPKTPMVWIALRSPQTTYAATTLEDLSGVVAYDGHAVDVIRFTARYGDVGVTARGRVATDQERAALEMLLRAHAPPGGTPYVSAILPRIPLNAALLATASNPKAIAVKGVLWGAAGTQALDALFGVDEHGNGSIGPLEARSGSGSIYARIALNRTAGLSLGIAQIRDFPLAEAKAAFNATLAGSGTTSAIQVAGNAGMTTSLGAAAMHGQVGVRKGALQGAVFGTLGSSGSFGAAVSGNEGSPRVAGTVVVAGGRYRNFNIEGNAGLAYANGTLNVHDAEVAVGPLFVGVAGTIAGLSPHGTFAPQYDMAAQLHSSDMDALVATVAPEKASLVAGSVDADVQVHGIGAAAAFAGRVSAPEGSINGLSFRDFNGVVSGNTSALSISDGHVVVGSSPISLSATATRAGNASVSVDGPTLDLADFNDFFDVGDMFAGTGSLALRAQVSGTRLLSSSGSAQLANAKFRRIDLGTVAARWYNADNEIATTLHFGGSTGEVALDGTIAPSSRSLDLNVNARRIDLATWLPMLGFGVPVTGRLDATTSLAGTYPDIAMRARAAVFDGTVGRLPIDRFEVTASAVHGRGTIESAVLNVPSMTTVASGTFGLRANDRLALVVTTTVQDLGQFLDRATGKDFAVSGSLSSTLHVEGTPDTPHLRDAVAVQMLRYRNVAIQRALGEIDADRHSIAVRNGEIDLDRGRALLSAAAPITVGSRGITPNNGPISGSLSAQDIELSNFADLLPKGTQLSGRIDGRVDVGGTVASPNLNGALALADGTFNGPMERSPITGIAGTLAFAGTRAQLQSHAFAGAGALTASAVASLADLRRPADARFTVDGRATNARLDVPAYFQGTLNGAVAIVRAPGALPTVSGDLAISNARLPLSAFLTLNKGGGGPTHLPDIAFDNFNVSAGRDVRVQSANVDIGTTGAVRLDGTLDAPSLAGSFHSTGGSLTFYRAFNIERADVTFDPSGGLVPNVDAVATTFIPNPATAIKLDVSGAATNMNIALASDPPYSRQQILGILIGVQQFGAVQGVASTGGSGFSAGSAAQSLARGQLDTVFTRNLLEPLSASVGNALGFTEVQITSDLQTGIGVNAVKAFGKYVTAIFRQTFGYPQTQSIALEAHPTEATGYRLTAFSSAGPTLFALQQPQPAAASVLNVNPATAFTPISGSSGVSFSFVRRYW